MSIRVLENELAAGQELFCPELCPQVSLQILQIGQLSLISASHWSFPLALHFAKTPCLEWLIISKSFRVIQIRFRSRQVQTNRKGHHVCLFASKNIREHSFYNSNFALFKIWFIFSAILYTFNSFEIPLPICERLSIFFEKFIIYWPTASPLAGVVLVLDWLYRTTNSSCSRFLLCRLYKNG